MNDYALLAEHLTRYPRLQSEDCIKLLHQKYMGPEHAIEDVADFADCLAKEMALPDLMKEGSVSAENIGNGLCRVHLSQVTNLQPATLAAICFMKSQTHVPDGKGLRAALQALKKWEHASRLGWPPGALYSVVDKYLAKGCPAIHHSLRYKELYHPHYRLLGEAEALFLPMFAAIDKALRQKAHVLVGIDGMSGAGKSRLSHILQQVYGCGVVHTDDFFLQPHQRTYERLAERGGNIDYERLSPVVQMAADSRYFSYQAYNCQTQQLEKEHGIAAGRLTIVEGVYSIHPRVSVFYDVKMFLNVDAKVQAGRIVERNGNDLARRFFAEWIPMENRYFAEFDVRQSCDVVLDTSGL